MRACCLLLILPENRDPNVTTRDTIPTSRWFTRLLQAEGLRALHHRNFRLFILGQLISVVGTWMQSTAQQWLVYSLTGSQLKLGTVTFAGFFPILLLSLFMGPIVDRLPRRTILLVTQTIYMVLAAVLAGLTALQLVQYWHILVLAVLLGIVNALDMPARQAFYIDLVPRDDLLNAIAVNSSVFNGARIIGPAAAGLVVAAIGEAPAFAINSISYLAVILALVKISVHREAQSAKKHTGWDQLREGLKYLVATREILGLVVMVAVFSVVGFPFMVLLPAVAVDVLNTGPEGFGVLVAAQGIGALLGALLLAGYGSHIRKGRMLLRSRFMLAGALALLGISHYQPLSMVALMIAGFAFIGNLALSNTLIQLISPDEVRGRVVSAYSWSLGGFYPLGAILYGFLGDHFVTSTAIVLGGVVCLLAALFSLSWFPETGELR